MREELRDEEPLLRLDEPALLRDDEPALLRDDEPALLRDDEPLLRLERAEELPEPPPIDLPRAAPEERAVEPDRRLDVDGLGAALGPREER